MPWSNHERMLLVLTLTALTLTGVLEVWNAACGGPIEATVRECQDSAGSCKWRVAFRGAAMAALASESDEGVPADPRDCHEEALRDFASFPGLLLYLAAPALWLLAALTRRRAWLAVGSAVVGAVVLIRVVALGLFTAVTF